MAELIEICQRCKKYADVCRCVKPRFRTKRKRSLKVLPISEKMKQVVVRVALGKTGPQIAEETGISVKSVEYYRAEVMARLGLKGRSNAMLAFYALHKGWVKNPFDKLEEPWKNG